MRNLLTNNAVTLFVVVIVLLLIIPMSPFMLDVMIIINIAVSLMILIISMNIKEALDFSIFPSLLLITTLFRLGINVSSTRNILSRGGEAGQVIKSFGSFVLQGNVVVGFVIFFSSSSSPRARSVLQRLQPDLRWTRCPVNRWRSMPT